MAHTVVFPRPFSAKKQTIALQLDVTACAIALEPANILDSNDLFQHRAVNLPANV